MSKELFTFDEQLKRLKEVANVKTDTDLTSLLGVKSSGVYNARRRGNIPHKWFVTISTRYGVNLEWLVSGTGTRNVGQQSTPGTCLQCAELQRQLAVAHERTYKAGEETKALLKENSDMKVLLKENAYLKEEIDRLNKELVELKREQFSPANDQPPMASAS